VTHRAVVGAALEAGTAHANSVAIRTIFFNAILPLPKLPGRACGPHSEVERGGWILELGTADV
jgi:hypothetical protein